MKELWFDYYERFLDLGYDEDQASIMADGAVKDYLATKIDQQRQEAKEKQNG